MSDNNNNSFGSVATWKWILGIVLSVTGAVIIALSIVVMNKLSQIDTLSMTIADMRADIKIIQADVKRIEAAAAELKGKSEGQAQHRR